MKRDLVMVVLLALLVIVAHGAVVGQWWLWDDPQLLYGVMQTPVLEHFVNPHAWQQESTANFVPMLMLGYEVDFRLFGVNPRGFYLHDLFVFIAAIAGVYAFARMYAEIEVAWIAAATIALSQPAFTVASLLMDRHYAEGLLMSIIALVLFRKSGERSLLALLATIFYFVACIEKEVFVPLPLLVIAQDWVTRNIRHWLRHAILCGGAALLYVVWRIAMLGSFGGYGGSSSAGTHLPGEALGFLGGFPGGIIFAIALLAIAIRRNAWRALPLVIAALIFAVLPIASLTVLDSRYLFVASVVMVLLCAAAVPRIRSIEGALFGALAILIVTGGVLHATRLRQNLDRIQRDGLYLWNAPATSRPLFTAANGWYVEGIRWLRHTVKGDDAPAAIASYPGLVMRKLSPQNVAFTSPQNPADVMRRYAEVRKHLDRAMPLSVELKREDSILRWNLGPAKPGDAFFLVTPFEELVWTRSASGWVRLPADIQVPTASSETVRMIRVMRRSGDSWTFSAPLQFPNVGETVTWRQW